MLTLDALILEAQTLPQIPLCALSAYHHHTAAMVAQVDAALSARDDIRHLIGNNPLQVMFDNHKHHAAFMTSVFSTGTYELLARTLPWVYQVYATRNFCYDYFPVELKAWMEALESHLSPEDAEPVRAVYAWMLRQHQNVIHLALNSDSSTAPPLDPEWLKQKNAFLSALLSGEHRRCVRLAESLVKTSADLEGFYLNIVQPCMYEVGILWERGFISVAQEHLASSIVGRVLAQVSMVDISASPLEARAIVTAAPDEFHEIGAWMVSDILEHDGWKVRYLGANTPVEDLIQMLKSFRPHILAMSVTMPFNLHKARQTIEQIRTQADIKDVYIIVGGSAFNYSSELWRSSGADAWAGNIHELRNITARFKAA